MTCVQVAYKVGKNEGDVQPCHVKELRPNDVFYIVTDGKKGDLMLATGMPYEKQVNGDSQWLIDGEMYE
jgi:hypothetical protein